MSEEPLPGGNVSAGVVRVGDTVRRPIGAHTPAVHALLRHLHEVGFSGVPRPLGIDDQGREVLTFIPGVVVHPDHRHLLDSVETLGDLGQLIRDLHDAAAEFVPSPDAQWQVVIQDVGAELIVHHDLAAWNLIAGTSGGWSVIDWDTAAPGTRLWDLAYTAHSLVPLTADASEAATDPGSRLRALVDGYGLDEQQRHQLVELLPRRTAAMRDLLARGADSGTEPWASLSADGHGDTWSRNTDYIAARSAHWLAALID